MQHLSIPPITIVITSITSITKPTVVPSSVHEPEVTVESLTVMVY